MNKVLVVIDMQNDFINGALGTNEAQALVPKVVKKINEFDGDIIVTQDTHHENYMDTLEGQKLPVKHCIKNEWGWEINANVKEALDKKQNVQFIEKPTFGSFNLIDKIADNIPEEIELCGLCTDICVVSNALMLRAAYPNTKIVINAELTEGVTPEKKQAALTTMKMCQIDVI